MAETTEALAQCKDMISGIFAGGSSKIIEYPLDTFKVLCQIHPEKSFSTLQLTRDVIQNEGITRIYRGLSAPLFGSCLEYFTTFWMFGAAERYFKSHSNKKELSMFEIGCCGAFSGIGISGVLTPIEFVKCQMQAEHTAKYYKSTMDCVRYHFRTNPLNFLTGLYATGLREIPGTFVYFIAYRGTTRFLKYNTNTPQSEESPTWMILSGGAMAGLSFWGIFYPVDLIKSQMQTQPQYIATNTANTVINNQSVVRLMIDRVKRYGFLSLYNGYSVTIPRAIISNACIFFVYEYCRKNLDNIM
eukprot:393963_1